jgi:hypothetical protein
MKKKLNLRELLNFYDYKVPLSKTHASAVNAVLGEDLAIALLVHYLKGDGLEVVALDGVCAQGTQRGYRLDKWISVQSATESVIYQVEIKNWSAHSIGGKTVKLDADEDYMREFRTKRWLHQFNVDKQVPSQKETLKVLTKMRVPTDWSNYKHEALLCFWEPLHHKGELEALFEVDVVSDAFKKLKVFSMSNYVSQLLKITETLEVELPDADARIGWLNKLYS